MMKSILIAILTICITLNKSQTLWVYDPTVWRSIPDTRLNIASSSNPGNKKYTECEQACIDAREVCLSFTWAGDVTNKDKEGECRLFAGRFGFPSSGFKVTTFEFGTGGVALLISKSGTTYFEKPIDYTENMESDNVGIHLVANALRLNGKTYKEYLDQTNLDFDYDQFLMYYRGGQPGYVNKSVEQSENKYSAIIEYEDVADPEECAKYCTRNRGAIDADLGTRCVSFNYHLGEQKCHLLTFSADGTTYNLNDVTNDNTVRSTNGITYDREQDGNTRSYSDWLYYEGLVGKGCWVIQSQCRRKSDVLEVGGTNKPNPDYVIPPNITAYNPFTPGGNIGIIRKNATDNVCSKCDKEQDWQKEYEYICLNYAREYHEDICDNDVDKATAAFWGQDGSGVAEFWNPFDLTEGCVIDLSTFQCNVNLTTHPEGPDPNPRFAGKKFRDSIGEEEFAAGVHKRACWRRAKEWYTYCGLGAQSNGTGIVYLNVSWPSDGSFYLEPAIDCKCDDYGLKVESGFGLGRNYCTRNSEERYCYRQKQENYWDEWDILCDDLTPPHVCSSGSGNAGGSGCYLYYPEPESTSRVAINYRCAEGGKYDFDEFTTVNHAAYREVTCAEAGSADCSSWTATDCANLAETIHNSCGNNLEDPDEQIIVWFRPTGEVMTFPRYKAPYETTWVRGISPSAFYTNSKDEQVDLMPIRNGRWQTFSPEKSGNLRQADVYYKNTINATLTMTIWFGKGITESVFLNQVLMEVNVDPTVGVIEQYVRFPLDNITLTAGETYTWQITSVTNDTNQLGDLGYVRGNGYSAGIGDLAWDYLFVTWIEGLLDSNQPLRELEAIPLTERPWFEIWCVMIIILFIIFLVFLCLLHWKRKYDEDRERREDKKFQAELRQRAMLQAEAERNAKQGIADDSVEYDSKEADGISDYDEEEENDNHGRERGGTDEDNYEEQPDDKERFPKKKSSEFLTVGGTGGGGSEYKRVKSASKNEMPSDVSEEDGAYIGDEERPKKKKKKKKKPKKRRSDDYEYDD